MFERITEKSRRVILVATTCCECFEKVMGDTNISSSTFPDIIRSSPRFGSTKGIL